MAYQFLCFDNQAIAEFAQHLADNPNNRRVTPSQYTDILSWLNYENRHPIGSAEHSRRNYVQRTFAWDAQQQQLYSIGTSGQEMRQVILTDHIAECVDHIHHNIGHRGWDATWRTVSQVSYGIMRQDVIFLLRRCLVCATNPAKQPKGSRTAGNSGAAGSSHVVGTS